MECVCARVRACVHVGESESTTSLKCHRSKARGLLPAGACGGGAGRKAGRQAGRQKEWQRARGLLPGLDNLPSLIAVLQLGMDAADHALLLSRVEHKAIVRRHVSSHDDFAPHGWVERKNTREISSSAQQA